MTYPTNDNDIEQHHCENYPITGSGGIPTWVKGESKEASKYQRNWIDSMTAEQHAKHLANELEYQKSKGNAKYY